MKGKIRKVIIITLISLLEIELIGWMALYLETSRNEGSNRFLQFAFSENGRLPPGEVVNYTEHHYLNYSINPKVPYMGTKQYNSDFRIRRSEPLRERQAVRSRGLAIGGSTTFGEMLPEEKQTWVWKAEQQLRSVAGEDVDLINGGIGGYSLEENMIHYLTLLTHLDPDYVLLYVGINDVHPRFFGTIQPDYSNYRRPWRSAGQAFSPPISWLRFSMMYRFYYLRTHSAQDLHIGAVAAYPYPPSSEWLSGLVRNSSHYFEINLRNLIHLIQGQGRHVILVPQIFIARKAEDKIFAMGVEQLNQVSKKVAAEMGLQYLDGVLTADISESELFDNCHFNEQGSEKFALSIASFLWEHERKSQFVSKGFPEATGL